MEMDILKKETERLVNIMKKLRGPNGCPWDKKQDYYSLQPYILEEAYEVVEALQNDNLDEIKEELGDLLLQVVFQAQIGEEKEDFDLADIMFLISEKMIRRHPHVFADKKINKVSEVMSTWKEIKEEEKQGQVQENKSLMDIVSQSQPALNQSYEIQAEAAKVGFDWDKVEDVIMKIEEELEELKTVVRDNNESEIKAEAGDLLFAVVNLTRFYKINPELALISSIVKFKERFKYIEKQVDDSKKSFKEFSLEELDNFWEESKKIEEDKS
jgi:tetrapyrrole methylase family protein/MazG family protein